MRAHIHKKLPAYVTTIICFIIGAFIVTFGFAFYFYIRNHEAALLTETPREYADTCDSTFITFQFAYGTPHSDASTRCFSDTSELYKLDSRYRLFSVPGFLQNAIYIQTGDVGIKNYKSLSWSAVVERPVTPYILYRHKVNDSYVPSWITRDYTRITPATISDFNARSYVLRRDAQLKYGYYDIYRYNNLSFQGTLSLGPAAEGTHIAASMYLVAFVPLPWTPSSSPSPTQIPNPPSQTAAPTPVRTTTPTPVPTPVPTLSPLEEVAMHNNPNDCWTVYNGHIYNVTAFFGSHPGGDSKLATACGVDITTRFDKESFHNSTAFNPTARQILQDYLIR